VNDCSVKPHDAFDAVKRNKSPPHPHFDRSCGDAKERGDLLFVQISLL
jgi:hypothetical protein